MLLSAVFAFPAHNSTETAFQVVRKAFDRQFVINAIFVQTRGDESEEAPVQMRVAMAESLGTKLTITRPTSMEGIASIDDRKEWRTYYPDIREIRVQVSPYRLKPETDFRMELIERNYSASISGYSEVAGRGVFVVQLKPKSRQMLERVMYVDRKEYAVLRYETQRYGEPAKRVLDTNFVQFNVVDEDEPFKFNNIRPAKEVRMWGPRPVKTAPEAAKFVGFQPKIPNRIGFGFVVQAIHLVGTEGEPFVGIRITDGMATVTIYQWDPKRFKGDEPFKGKAMGSDTKGIKFTASGDAPPDVLKLVITAFVLQGK